MIAPITREEANTILKAHAHLPMQQVVICASGNWYDIRQADHDEVEEFIQSWAVSRGHQLPLKRVSITL